MISRVSVHAGETKPIWTTSTFLVYAGGLTVLASAIAAVGYLAGNYGSGFESAAWAFLILLILYAIAHALRLRERPIAAGIFAFASVIAWGFFVAHVFTWWGWDGYKPATMVPLHHWSWSRLALELLVLAAAWDDRRRFRFPFIRVISAVVFWAFVVDLLPAGNVTYVATIVLGLLYLAIGNVVDRPSAFWLHLVGGVLIGYPILHWCHRTDGDFAVVLIASIVFVWIAHWTRRSSWAVLGTIGFFLASSHYIYGSSTALFGGIVGVGGGGSVCTGTSSGGPPVCHSIGPGYSPWAPALGFGLLGLWLVLLGILGRRRRPAVVVESAVVVETAPPPPPPAPAAPPEPPAPPAE